MEARVRVIYSATKGYPDTWEEPGAPDEIKIISIAPIGSEVEIPLALYTDDDLLTDCHADWIEMQEEVREWRAQSRRDDALMEASKRRGQ
ncbi:hypothetical protein AB5I41_31055 [Sphingomonas sp. MMS24-JH45]